MSNRFDKFSIAISRPAALVRESQRGAKPLCSSVAMKFTSSRKCHCAIPFETTSPDWGLVGEVLKHNRILSQYLATVEFERGNRAFGIDTEVIATAFCLFCNEVHLFQSKIEPRFCS